MKDKKTKVPEVFESAADAVIEVGEAAHEMRDAWEHIKKAKKKAEPVAQAAKRAGKKAIKTTKRTTKKVATRSKKKAKSKR